MVVLTAMEGRSQSGGEDGISGTILRLEANADVVCGDFREADLLKWFVESISTLRPAPPPVEAAAAEVGRRCGILEPPF